jgi:hypothetical protein
MHVFSHSAIESASVHHPCCTPKSEIVATLAIKFHLFCGTKTRKKEDKVLMKMLLLKQAVLSPTTEGWIVVLP